MVLSICMVRQYVRPALARIWLQLISRLAALYSFPISHWLVIVIVSYISLLSKPACKQTTQRYIVLGTHSKILTWPTWYKYKENKSLYGAQPFLLFVVESYGRSHWTGSTFRIASGTDQKGAFLCEMPLESWEIYTLWLERTGVPYKWRALIYPHPLQRVQPVVTW